MLIEPCIANKTTFPHFTNLYEIFVFSTIPFFEVILLKLSSSIDNLQSFKSIVKYKTDIIDLDWKFGICRMRDKSNHFYWSSHIIYPTRENWIIRYTGSGNLDGGQIRLFSGQMPLYSPRSSTQFSNDSEIELLVLYYYN